MLVLNLIDAASPQARGTTLALMAAAQDRLGDHVSQRTLLLGGTELARSAAQAGLCEATVLSTPGGRAEWGWPAARWHLRGHNVRPDLVHAWSVRSLMLGLLLYPRTPRVLTLALVPPRPVVHWLRWFVAEAPGPTVLLPISNTIRRELLSGGVAESAVHVLRPGLDLGRVPHTQRPTLRSQWGWGAAPERHTVVALLSDPPEATDVLPAMMAAGLACEVAATGGGRVHLLVHPRQTHRLRARRVARGIGKPDNLIDEPRLDRPWEILPACDAALTLGPHGGGLSLLWAMAAGVPIVAQASYAVSEIVEDRHSALLTRPGSAATLARRLGQILADPGSARTLADTARHEAFSYFSRQRYGRALATVYGQILAGQPVAVPPLEITGGLRFQGTGGS